MKIIFAHGDKGGIGKTEAATRTAAAYLAAEKPLTMIDGDAKNPGLHRLFDTPENPVHCCNVLKTEGIEEMFELIASAKNDVLIDLPAGASAATEKMAGGNAAEGSIDLGEILSEIGARAVVLFTIDQNPEPVAALRDELNAFPIEMTDWIVVKNHREERPFNLFDGSKTKEELVKRGGKIIDMIRLDPAVTSRMTTSRLNLFTIQQAKEVSMIPKVRAKSALRQWTEQLKIAGLLDG